MSWTGYCVQGLHLDCPDSFDDQGSCDCPCHLTGDAMSEEEDALEQFFGKMPGRPNHPDFWRLAECVMRNDASVDDNPRMKSARVVKGRSPERPANPMDGIVDEESFMYMMDQRVARMLQFIRAGVISYGDPETVLKGVYMDAWMTGYRFHEAGGHRGR